MINTDNADLRAQLETPEGLDALLETTKAGRDLLKEVSEERKFKTRTTDKFADYCIERNFHVEEIRTLRLDKKRLDWLEALPCAFTIRRDQPKADSLPSLRTRLDEAMKAEENNNETF